MCIEELIPFGKENAISNIELQVVTGLNDRAVRKAVSEARKRGVVILNMQDGNGYYQPTEDDRAEVQHYYLQEHRRAMSNLKSLKATRKWLEQVKGQIDLTNIPK